MINHTTIGLPKEFLSLPLQSPKSLIELGENSDEEEANASHFKLQLFEVKEEFFTQCFTCSVLHKHIQKSQSSHCSPHPAKYVACSDLKGCPRFDSQ